MERTMSSKRSGAGSALVPSGLTERQALALALEESRRAAVAAKRTAMQDDDSSSSGDSSSDDESSAGGTGGRGEGNRTQPPQQQQQQQQQGARESKPAKRRRPKQRPGSLLVSKESGKMAGTPRKKPRVEAVEFRTATSSENSKASRTTQQLLDLGGSLRGSLEGSLNGTDVAAAAAGRRRGDSADSEHNSISGGSGQNAPPGGAESVKVKHEVGSEGAGESGGLEQQQQRQPAPDQGLAGQLDAHTIAEMARKRRERFGTSEPAAAQKAAPKPLRRAPSGLAPPKVATSSAAQPECIARSRSSLAALVESDLFPDTPRRGTAASKTATPAVTPTLAPSGSAVCKAEPLDKEQQVEELQKVCIGGGDAAAAVTGLDLVASPVRTPSPVAGSPRSLQASETLSGDVAGVVSQKLRGVVKHEESEGAPHEVMPPEATCGEQQAAPKQPKQRRKPGPSPKQLARQRLPALQVQRDSPDLAMLDPLAKAEGGVSQAPRKGRGCGGGNRGARSVSRTPSRNSRWASSHLNSPGPGRRLRSAVVEEFKHNTDATDPFAWQPQTPSRARASALLAACAILALQDLPAPVADTPRAADQDPPVACPKQQQEAELQRQEQAVRDYVQQPSPCAEPDYQAAEALCQLPDQAQPDQAQPDEAQERAPDQAAAAMDVELELSGEPATPLGSPQPAAAGREVFFTPVQQVMRCGSVEFPALDASAAATPALCTPTLTPAVKWRAPLWKKLHPLSLDFQSQAEQCSVSKGSSAVATPAPGARQQAFAAAAALPSPARAHVAGAAALVSAAFKGRHGLEGRRLELSSSCAADEPGLWKPEAAAAAEQATPFHGSRIGKALAAGYGRNHRGGAASASFRGACNGLRAPYMRARNMPAWRSASMSRSGSAGSSCGLGVNPHLARQRTQRNLQNTWDDLLARQALEATTAEALVAWSQPPEQATA
ncbi:hypothetical protein COCOBI_16-0340 [Coccomyxa sp. Obi]|nr:hypothetical protein COCOBI_16-0340 [Coccomyxa sp. Obi]